MDQLLSFLITLIGFWIVLNILYRLYTGFFEKHNLKLYYSFILVYKRSKKLRSSAIYRRISYIHVALFVLTLTTFYYAMIYSIMVKLGFFQGATVQLLVPGINITGIQLIYFAIAIIVAAAVHELMHAYTAVSHGLHVKSIGFAVLLVVPIAFTEIDEEELGKAPTRSKIAVLASGPASNYLLALAFLFILTLVMSPYGIVVLDVLPNSLAEKYGLKPGDVIVAINDEPLTRSLLAKYLNNKSDVVFRLKIISNGVEREVEIYKPSNVTRLGIAFSNKPCDQLISLLGLDGALSILFMITWLHIVNLGLAIINAAPIFISDGGRIFYELFRDKRLGHIVNMIGLAILVLALTPIR